MIQQGLAQGTFLLVQAVQLRSEDEDMGRLPSSTRVLFIQLLVVDRGVSRQGSHHSRVRAFVASVCIHHPIVIHLKQNESILIGLKIQEAGKVPLQRNGQEQ